MPQQIGMDPVELEALVQKFIDENRGSFDALIPEAQIAFRKALRDQIEAFTMLLDEERRKTIDHVLLIIDQVDRLTKVPPYLKEVLIRFRDDDKPPPFPGGTAR